MRTIGCLRFAPRLSDEGDEGCEYKTELKCNVNIHKTWGFRWTDDNH